MPSIERPPKPSAGNPGSSRKRIVAALRGKSSGGARRKLLLDYRKSLDTPPVAEGADGTTTPIPVRFGASLPVSASVEARDLLRDLMRGGKVEGLHFPDGLRQSARILGRDAQGKQIEIGRVQFSDASPGEGDTRSWGLHFSVQEKRLLLTAHVPSTGYALQSPQSRRRGDLGFRLKQALKPFGTTGGSQ